MYTWNKSGLFKYVVGGASAVLAVAGMTFVSPVNSVSAATRGTCNQKFHATVDGAEAAWSLSCYANKITITGWVKDTDADGKCAYVKAEAPGQKPQNPIAKACPKNKVTHFDWTVPGSKIDASLYAA